MRFSADIIESVTSPPNWSDGAVCWISKALEHAWPLPRFEADEFAAAFVAANKPSAKTRRMDYIAKLLHIVARTTSERQGIWNVSRIFSGSLARVQAQYGFKYL